MTLSPGTRLGPYEVLSPLGAGGMGEVFRARDTRLDRQVAIKLLPDSFRADPDRLARFEREARMVAALNHPNIAQVYGVEGADERAIVMELVEGDTLAELIARGPLPVNEALRVARQIAAALDAAHEQGIVHRDLKPANVKVRPDGTAKVLDFGLAKLAAPADAGSMGPAEAGHYEGRSAGLQAGLSMSPTLTSPALMTGAGMILGTAAYMSPEQARGRPVDRRADVWAFGCVLYEMLGGRRAFDGDDVTMVLANVLKTDPDWSALPPDVPPQLAQLLHACLRKDAADRVASLSVALFVIDESLRQAASLDPAAGRGPAIAVDRPRRRPSRLRVAAIGAACVAAAGLVGSLAWLAFAPRPIAVTRTSILTIGAAAVAIRASADRSLAITPDGTHVVYVGADRLYTRALDRPEPAAVNGSGTGSGVFVSPDGQWIGYFRGWQLQKLPLAGGTPTTIADILGGAPRGATWGPDDTIVFATANRGTGLLRVAASGGPVTTLTVADRGKAEDDHLWPHFLPDGRAVLFTVFRNNAEGAGDNAEIAVLDLRTGVHRTLVPGGSDGRYVASGHIVYRSGSELRAVAFDAGRLEVTGTPVTVVPDVMNGDSGWAAAAVSAGGTLVYVAGTATPPVAAPTWVDRGGRESPVGVPPRLYSFPRLSPDGDRLALQAPRDIWILTFANGALTRLTVDPALDRNQVWSADGRRIAFASDRGGALNLFWQAADGSGTAERLTTSDRVHDPRVFTADGQTLIFREIAATYDLYTLPLSGARTPRPLITTPFHEDGPDISPDGRWLAYMSDESGRPEVYVRPYPDVESARWQVSTSGGAYPAWSPSGHELFYVEGEARLMRVPLDTASTFKSGRPQVLFDGPYNLGIANGLGPRFYDVARDGERFLVLKVNRTGVQAEHATVVQHWFEELERLVPAR